MSKQINWGVLGLGKIAKKFLHDLNLSRIGNVYAVGSRNLDKANQYKSTFYADKAYGSYSSLLEDPLIDVVYIATPHSHHYPLLIECIDRGINVLCEKPICVNQNQLLDIQKRANDKGVFVMEALWTRFLPFFEPLMETIESFDSSIRALYAEFCFTSEYDSSSRLYDPLLAGGSLMDIGIYPVFLALQIMGSPQNILTNGYVSKGVDLRFSSIFDYGEGRSAMVSSDITTDSNVQALIKCGNSSIVIPERWHESDLFISKEGRNFREYRYPKIGFGYYHEIEHVNEMILDGQKESSKFNLENSIELMGNLDHIRDQIGLVYPDNIESVRN
ncbi:Gfo/Idh/MocA family protein [Membranihabitans maritimus]|uniref:Gfo/Idh/MocA family protein n=1 Tax=Membranihabitans maritimus TaxID=2904244 RepID=UPI001F15F301|nr:Gfo/Idh/MocA family oxidoreductase [Membranihabitans maritimus]